MRMNKVSLIIPDIHLKWERAEKVIATVKHDEVIFLGDYFDDFGDTPQLVESGCEWFESSVKKPNRIHLFGNHDVHYAFPYRKFQCSGYAQWKYFMISDSVSRETWDKLKWYHNLDDTWLLSHAGVHSHHVPKDIKSLTNNRPEFFKALTKYLDDSVADGFRAIANSVPHWVFGAGRSRGGSQQTGGIIWCDYEQEFSPTKGLNQIVGHTPQRRGHAKWVLLDERGVETRLNSYLHSTDEHVLRDSTVSVNLDLDVAGTLHYGVWDGKNLTVGVATS